MKKQIIIDNDGGTDDFVAILYAFLSKKFDVKAISLVAGNTDVNNVKENVFKALEMAGVTPEEAEKIGIYLPERVNENIISDGAQGDNGLGNVKYEPAVGYKINTNTAEDMLIDAVNKNPNAISIVATGPLTNIASVLDKDPEFAKKVKEIVIMGGDEGGGNITPYAEFNIYQDPEAAKKVFEAGFENITMIGFNITKQITFCPEVEKFLKENGEEGKFLYDITRATADLDRGKNKVDGASMNDILTLMYLLEEEGIFETKQAGIKVDTSNNETRGQTQVIANNEDLASCNVVTGADGTKIIREMLTTIFPDKTKDIENALEGREDRIKVRNYLIRNLPARKEEVLRLWNQEGAEVIMRDIEELIEEAKKRAAKLKDKDER